MFDKKDTSLFFFINLSVTDVKNFLKWLAMALSSVVITLFIHKLI